MDCGVATREEKIKTCYGSTHHGQTVVFTTVNGKRLWLMIEGFWLWCCSSFFLSFILMSLSPLSTSHSLSKTSINKPFKPFTFCTIFHPNCHKSLDFHPFSSFLQISLFATQISTCSLSNRPFNSVYVFSPLSSTPTSAFTFFLTFSLSTLYYHKTFSIPLFSPFYTPSPPLMRIFASIFTQELLWHLKRSLGARKQWPSRTSWTSTSKRTQGNTPLPLGLTHFGDIACYTCLISALVVATYFYDKDLLAQLGLLDDIRWLFTLVGRVNLLKWKTIHIGTSPLKFLSTLHVEVTRGPWCQKGHLLFFLQWEFLELNLSTLNNMFSFPPGSDLLS